jgi:hypothetical protein
LCQSAKRCIWFCHLQTGFSSKTGSISSNPLVNTHCMNFKLFSHQGAFVKSWKSRYFVLRSGDLSYFKVPNPRSSLFATLSPIHSLVLFHFVIVF